MLLAVTSGALVLAGCGDGTASSGGAGATTTVSGNISGSDRALAAITSGVPVSIAGQQASTGSSGGFTLQGVPYGHHALVIGRGANAATMPLFVPAGGHIRLHNIVVSGSRASHSKDNNQDGYFDDDLNHDGRHDDDRDHDGWHDDDRDHDGEHDRSGRRGYDDDDDHHGRWDDDDDDDHRGGWDDDDDDDDDDDHHGRWDDDD